MTHEDLKIRCVALILLCVRLSSTATGMYMYMLVYCYGHYSIYKPKCVMTVYCNIKTFDRLIN